jgi:hypothetical protein
MLAFIGSGFTRELDVLTGFIPRLTATSFGVGRYMDTPSRAAFFNGMGTRGRRALHDYIRDARQCDKLYEEIARALAGPLSGLPLLTVFWRAQRPIRFSATLESFVSRRSSDRRRQGKSLYHVR